MTASDRELERRHRAETVDELFNTCRSEERKKKLSGAANRIHRNRPSQE